MAILIDEGSASASEILAGAIQDNDRGPSLAAGRLQRPCSGAEIFLDGSALRLTIAAIIPHRKKHSETLYPWHRRLLQRPKHKVPEW